MRLLLVSLFLPAPLLSASTGCFATPREAVRAFIEGAGPRSSLTGYRVAGVHADALRGAAWALIEECGKPAQPSTMMALPPSATHALSAHMFQQPVVHVGDAVVVLAHYGASTIELRGRAEQSGAVGTEVRVALPNLFEQESTPPRRIACKVLGANLVEVVP